MDFFVYKIWVTVLLVFCVMVSCDSSLENYGGQLIKCSEPGENCRQYLSGLNEGSALKLLSMSYGEICKRWIHICDPQGDDRPGQAEQLFRENYFAGDCEDQAVMIVAIARELRLKTRYCLAKQKDRMEGHIWAEVLIGSMDENLQKINYMFPNTSIVNEGNLYYLAFIPQKSIDDYEVEYYVEIN